MAAATSTASCDRPPVSDTIAVRGGLALTGNRADQSRQDAAGADADEVAIDIRRLVGIRHERPRRRRGLHHDDDGDDQRQRHQLQPSADRNVGNGKRRQRDRDIAENRDAPAFKSQQHDGRGGRRPGRSARRECGRRSAPKSRSAPARQGRCTSVNRLVCGSCSARVARRCSIGPSGDGQPEDGRQLRDQDVHRDAGEKADGHRDRQQIGDPAETKNAADDQHNADHQRQHAGERCIFGRAGHRQQSEAAGKDRRDGRIGAAGQEAVASENGEGQRARQKCEKSDLRRKPAQPRRRQLLGDRDRGKRKPGDEIVRQKRGTIPLSERNTGQP